MIRTNDWGRMAPDDGLNGALPNNVLDTLPQANEGDIGAWDDIELEDENASKTPPELAGKTQAELIDEINRRDAAALAQAPKADSAALLADQFSQFLKAQAPKAGPLPEGYRVKQTAPQMTAADLDSWKKKTNELFLDDPAAAASSVIGREFGPVLVQMAESQALMSKRLVKLDPETKDIYAKYAGEIEAEVAEADAGTKFRNPNIYQDAVERARARHYSELVAETTTAQQEAIATKYLESLGLNLADIKARGVMPQKPVAPASSTLASAGRVTPATPATKTKISLNATQRAMVDTFAKARGVSPEAAAAHLRSKGAI